VVPQHVTDEKLAVLAGLVWVHDPLFGCGELKQEELFTSSLRVMWQTRKR